jgi:hypothetical protein
MQFEKILPDLAGKELCSLDHVLWSKARTIWLPLHVVALPSVVDKESTRMVLLYVGQVHHQSPWTNLVAVGRGEKGKWKRGKNKGMCGCIM